MGQSVDIRHLGKYLRKTRDKAYKRFRAKGYSEEMCQELAEDRMMEDLKSGVQTIQYQVNTLMTCNGFGKRCYELLKKAVIKGNFDEYQMVNL